MKFSGYYFHMNTNLLGNFQIWISVTLNLINLKVKAILDPTAEDNLKDSNKTFINNTNFVTKFNGSYYSFPKIASNTN